MVPLIAHQSFQFFPVNRVVPLEDTHGFMPCSRHDTEIVMTLLAFVGDKGMP
jgi:hypothetical protein